MRAFFLSCAFIFSVFTSVSASEIGFAEVISSQIEAFKNDDVETAFSFASPKVQTTFGTAQNFGVMVQNTYPMIWRPADFKFLRGTSDRSIGMQEVIFFDGSGKSFTFAYELVDISGSWKINGVYRLETDDVAV